MKLINSRGITYFVSIQNKLLNWSTAANATNDKVDQINFQIDLHISRITNKLLSSLILLSTFPRKDFSFKMCVRQIS